MLSKQLATIPTDAPVSLDLPTLKMAEPDSAALRELYARTRLHFAATEFAPLADTQKTDYAKLELAGRAAEIPRTSSARAGNRRVAFARFRGSRRGRLRHAGSQRRSFDEARQARIAANDVEDKTLDGDEGMAGGPEAAENRARPETFSAVAAIDSAADRSTTPQSPEFATRPCSIPILLRPTTANHEFAEVVLRHLNRTLSGAPGERADFLLRVRPCSSRRGGKTGPPGSLRENRLAACWPVLARMEAAGVRVDPDRTRPHLSEDPGRNHQLEKSIYGLAGFEFNINSPQQLAEVLFDRLNLQAPRRSRAKVAFYRRGNSRRAGADSRTAEKSHRIPRAIETEIHLFRRSPAPDSSCYPAACTHAFLPDRHRDWPPQLLESESAKYSDPHRARPRNSGRIRCSSPGRLLLSADYSQIELRILAHLSEDPVLADAFRRGEDIHSRTAQEVFDVAPFAQTREHRRVAKVINFGVIYGLSPFGLAQKLDIDQKEAAKFIAKYFERYQRREEISRPADRGNAQDRGHQNSLRTHPPNPRNQFAAT